MTDREILIELLAIKLFEDEGGKAWIKAYEYDRNIYRDLIRKALCPRDIYAVWAPENEDGDDAHAA